MSDNLQLSQGGCIALSSGALAAGTNAGTIQTTATITYLIDGIFKSKGATNNISIAYSGADVYSDPGNGSFTGQSGGSTRIYGVFLDGAGAVSVVPGPIVNSAELAAGVAPLQWPSAQRNKAFIGALRIAVTEGTTFIPGTTALDAAGVTDTFYNGGVVPGEPLLS